MKTFFKKHVITRLAMFGLGVSVAIVGIFIPERTLISLRMAINDM